MNETAPSFWSSTVRSLAARMPPWPILALVAGHLILHAGINFFWKREFSIDEFSTKGLLLGPLYLCQVSLIVVWVALGRTPGPLRALALVLVVALLWMPQVPTDGNEFLGAVGRFFWPNVGFEMDPGSDELMQLIQLAQSEAVGPYYFFAASFHSLALAVQLIVLGAPLAALRLARLRIGRSGDVLAPPRCRWQFSIKRLLLWTATVAIALVVLRSVPFESWWEFISTSDLARAWLVLGCVTLPAVFCALTATLGNRLNLAWLLVPILVAFALESLLWRIPYQLGWGLFHIWYGPGGMLMFPTALGESDIEIAWTGPLVTTLVPFVSLLVVRYAGYRLTWRRSTRSAGAMRQAAS